MNPLTDKPDSAELAEMETGGMHSLLTIKVDPEAADRMAEK